MLAPDAIKHRETGQKAAHAKSASNRRRFGPEGRYRIYERVMISILADSQQRLRFVLEMRLSS